MKTATELAREAADKLGLRLPPTDEGIVQFVLLNSLEALERARVVAVLDGWAGKHARAFWRVEQGDDCICVGEVDEGARGVRRHFRHAAHTPDAARAAAARAIEAGEV